MQHCHRFFYANNILLLDVNNDVRCSVDAFCKLKSILLVLTFVLMILFVENLRRKNCP